MRFTGNGITNCYPDQVEDFISITVLTEIAEAALSTGLNVVLSTNGLLFAKRGLAILPTSVRLHISIDSGFAEVHEASRVRRNLLPSIGSLEQVMSVTAHAVHAGYRVRVLTCIGRHNFRQLIELGERLAIAGVNEWNISRVLAAGRAGFGNCGQWNVDDSAVLEEVHAIRNCYPWMRVRYSNRTTQNGYFLLVLPDGSLASVRRKTRKSLILQGVPPILSGEDRRDVVFFAGDLPRIDPFRDHLRDIAIMREVHRSQFQLGQVPIEEIWINPKSRDDIPAVLKGLQHIWCDEELRERLFALLDEHILPEADRTVGRPGMDLWQILVLGVLKQGLGCDFDRLHELTNHHETIRAFLGHADWDDKTRYEYQTVVDNVSLLTPELLSAVGRLVVESGHKVAKKKPGEPLRGRCDSFVVETDVHYPTDVNLLWDAVRCLLRETGRAAEKHAVGGWRQWRYLCREVKKLFNKVRSTRRAQRHPERVEAYVERCRTLVERAEATLDALRNQGAAEFTCRSIAGFVAHARRQIDQVERRLLRGETIPHEEKVFSIFEGHTRWISKGKAGTPVELGVPVALIEDQYGFILHHEVLWEGEDVDVAVPMVKQAQVLYPQLRACSFDRGFHSPANRVGLDALLDINALPGKGYLSKANREREAEESFVAARRAHPAIESAINGLEHRGLDRVRSHGAEGFARTVALSVLAANLHRIGLILQKRERKRRRRVA